MAEQSYNGQGVRAGVLLWYVGCDEGSHGHQGESQDEAQGEVDDGGATQQHSQVQHSNQLQHFPALLRPLARHEPSTNSVTNSSLSCITVNVVQVSHRLSQLGSSWSQLTAVHVLVIFSRWTAELRAQVWVKKILSF